MADNFVQLPDDGPNTGKKVRTHSETIGGNVVHTHVFVPAVNVAGSDTPVDASNPMPVTSDVVRNDDLSVLPAAEDSLSKISVTEGGAAAIAAYDPDSLSTIAPVRGFDLGDDTVGVVVGGYDLENNVFIPLQMSTQSGGENSLNGQRGHALTMTNPKRRTINFTTPSQNLQIYLTQADAAGVPATYGHVGISIEGTWTGTIEFQASVDGYTYYPIAAHSNAGETQISTTANGIWQVMAAGISIFQVIATALSSGQANVVLYASPVAGSFSSALGGLPTTTGAPVGVTVSTSAVLLAATNTSRKTLQIVNTGSGNLYIGNDSGVTASGATMGLLLQPGGSYSDSGPGLFTGDWYGIYDVTAATENVSVVERT